MKYSYLCSLQLSYFTVSYRVCMFHTAFDALLCCSFLYGKVRAVRRQILPEDLQSYILSFCPWLVCLDRAQEWGVSVASGSCVTEGRPCQERDTANQMACGLILDKELYIVPEEWLCAEPLNPHQHVVSET